MLTFGRLTISIWADIYDEPFIDQLFELVERTRSMEDETLNYASIRLIVRFSAFSISLDFHKGSLLGKQIALNEQFMVATLPSRPSKHSGESRKEDHLPADPAEAKKLNRVLKVLMQRLGASKTFGENMIFMLNRAGSSFFSTVLLA